MSGPGNRKWAGWLISGSRVYIEYSSHAVGVVPHILSGINCCIRGSGGWDYSKPIFAVVLYFV